MRHLRVVQSGAAAPALNMAIDDAMLAAGDTPVLRLYGWQPAGLSLGYFQPIAPFLDVPGDHQIVRRCTGGGAIYHAEELTFALVLDASDLPVPTLESYRLVHQAIARALASIGVEVAMVEAGTHHPNPTQPWCFAVPGYPDLVSRQRKILGSAQRRVARPTPRILHHGSLVLRAPPATPFCGAVADWVEPDLVIADLRMAIVTELAAALGFTPENAGLGAVESELAAELHTTRHTQASHRNRR